MSTFSDDEIRISSTQLRKLFSGICHMTVKRWVDAGVIPKPEKINGRNYWRRGDLQRALQRHQEVQKPSTVHIAAAMAAKDRG